MKPRTGSWLRRVRERRNGLRRMSRINATERADRMTLLAQLAGKLSCEHGFSADELMEAEASLRLPPRSRQAALPLVRGGSR